MKEVEKNEIKRLSDRLDAIRHQQADLSRVEAADKYAELEKEKATLEAEIARLREVHSQKLSKEAQKLMKMPFQRAITKKEQADMGKLKKSVRGLVVVHPMTALGREMGLQEMTGFSKTAFKEHSIYRVILHIPIGRVRCSRRIWQDKALRVNNLRAIL